MVNRIKRVFRLKILLIIFTVTSIVSLLLAYLSPFIEPGKLSVIPLFGLAFGPILLANLILLIIWSLYRSKVALIILAVILLGGKLHLRLFALGSNENAGEKTTLHIMSYNVRLFNLYHAIKSHDKTTRNNIFSYISEKGPDVICFQEFFHQDHPTRFTTKDSIIKFYKPVDYHERYAQKMYGRQNFGIALFSKYPIIEKGFVNFPEKHKTFNYCIYADIVKELDTFRVYNVHLQSIRLQRDDYALFNEQSEQVAEQSSNILKLLNKIRKAYPVRAEQAQLIANHVKRSKHPVILCGDFNDTPLSYSYNVINGNLIDAYRNTSIGIGSTYAGNAPAGRIDYFFHSPKIGSREFNIQEEKLSDHYAIDCKFFLKENDNE